MEFLCCPPSVSSHLDVCSAGHDGQTLNFIPDPLCGLWLPARLCHSHGPLYPQKRGRVGSSKIPYSSSLSFSISALSIRNSSPKIWIFCHHIMTNMFKPVWFSFFGGRQKKIFWFCFTIQLKLFCRRKLYFLVWNVYLLMWVPPWDQPNQQYSPLKSVLTDPQMNLWWSLWCLWNNFPFGLTSPSPFILLSFRDHICWPILVHFQVQLNPDKIKCLNFFLD